MRSLPRKRVELHDLAVNALKGAIVLGAEVGLAQNTPERIAADIEAVFGASGQNGGTSSIGELLVARGELVDVRKVRREALAAARTFCTSTIDRLKPVLGRTWNVHWMDAGFTSGSLSVPRSNPLGILYLLWGFFQRHPEHEMPGVDMTARRAMELADALCAATSAREFGRTRRVEKSKVYEQKLDRLRKRLTALRGELDLLLEPDDARWRQFGFKRPTDVRRPEPVSSVEIIQRDDDSVWMEWPKARRARYYSARWQTTEQDAPWHPLPLARDPSMRVRGLPPGVDVVIALEARNRSGSSPALKFTVGSLSEPGPTDARTSR